MKITIITKYWKNSDGGGIKIYLVNLVEALKSRGADVCIFFREGYDPEQFQYGWNKITFSISCYRQLRKIRPDVVHSQGTWYCLLPGVMYKLIYSCNLVHTFRSEPDKKLPFVFKIFYQSLLNRCNCVTFVSKGLQQIIQEMDGFYFHRTEITYPGVRPKNVIDNEIQEFQFKYNIRENSPVLLIQGFTANKLKSEGIKLVLKSLKFLIHSHPDIILIITREGIYSQELKEYARSEGIESNVRFTGNLENPFVPLELCDIFLFPWLGKSGVGNSLLEAMCMGKPIIATSVNSQGVSEVIVNNESGILIEPEQSELANRIEFLLANEDLRIRLGQNAKLEAKKKFTWDNCADTFLQIYNIGE